MMSRYFKIFVYSGDLESDYPMMSRYFKIFIYSGDLESDIQRCQGILRFLYTVGI